jgi:hypothetical protein
LEKGRTISWPVSDKSGLSPLNFPSWSPVIFGKCRFAVEFVPFPVGLLAIAATVLMENDIVSYGFF